MKVTEDQHWGYVAAARRILKVRLFVDNVNKPLINSAQFDISVEFTNTSMEEFPLLYKIDPEDSLSDEIRSGKLIAINIDGKDARISHFVFERDTLANFYEWIYDAIMPLGTKTFLVPVYRTADEVTIGRKSVFADAKDELELVFFFDKIRSNAFFIPPMSPDC